MKEKIRNLIKSVWKYKIAFILGMIAMGGLVYFYDDVTEKTTVQYLPSFYFSDSIPGLVGGTGVWTAKGEKLANKYNAAYISCFNDYGDMSFSEIRKKYGIDPASREIEMYCYIAQADIINNYLNSDLQLFSITDWNENAVVAEFNGICRKTVMILDRKAKTVTQTGTLVGDSELCEGLSKEPIQAYLEDGSKVLGDY